MATVSTIMSTNSGYLRSSESGSISLTDKDLRDQIFNLSATATVTLPSSGIKTGDIFTLYNSSANDLVVNSSNASSLTVANGANIDATIQGGFVKLLALQDTPTTPAHWRVLDVYEQINNLSITYGNCIPSTTVTGNYLIRRNNVCTIRLNAFASDVTANATTTMTTNAFMPVRTRSQGGFCGFLRMKNGATNSFIRMCPVTVTTGGALTIYATMLDVNTTPINFTSGNLVSIWEYGFLTWHIL